MHLGATLEAEEIRNDRHADRHERACAKALQHAECDELDHAPRQTGQRGTDEKDHETGEERRPPSEQIGEASPERHGDGGRQEEPGKDPRVDLEPAQALHDDRHGSGDHGRFHRREEHGQHHAQQGAAPQALVHQRGLGSCVVGPHLQRGLGSGVVGPHLQ